MKTKKTLKRLDKVVELLSSVIGRLPDKKNGVEGLLDSAKASVVQAKKIVDSQPVEAEKTAAPKAEKARTSRLTAEGRKRISLAAKRRWEKARRKGVNPMTGRKLSKTA